MSENIIKLKKTHGSPTVEIIIGRANFGTYKVKLWDKDGSNPKLIGTGFNDDAIDDEHSINGFGSINGKFLSWKATTAKPDNTSSARYGVTVLIRQKGKTVEGGLYQYSGKLKKNYITVGGFGKCIVS